jgi:hypothetical protein
MLLQKGVRGYRRAFALLIKEEQQRARNTRRFANALARCERPRAR